MGIVTPGYAPGAAGQALSGKLLRLAAAAPFRASGGVQYVSGVLYGPPGTMGELTLGSNTSLTINPFTAVVQNTLDVTAGPFLITNDAAVTATPATTSPTPTLPAQDASQFRRALIVTRKDDSQLSGVASSATTDRALLDIRAGALAASAAAAVLPAVGANELALGELLIPPAGQTVTLTAYNPRTTTRGGILPVVADGSTTIAGHDGVPGTGVGHYRDHRTNGLERWDGSKWGDPLPLSAWVDDIFSTNYTYAMQAGFGNPPSMSARTVTLPPGRTLEVDLVISAIAVAPSTSGYLQMYLWFGANAGAYQDAAYWSTNGSTSIVLQNRWSGHLTNTASAAQIASFSLAGACSSGSVFLNASPSGVPNTGIVHLRHRIV